MSHIDLIPNDLLKEISSECKEEHMEIIKNPYKDLDIDLYIKNKYGYNIKIFEMVIGIKNHILLYVVKDKFLPWDYKYHSCRGLTLEEYISRYKLNYQQKNLKYLFTRVKDTVEKTLIQEINKGKKYEKYLKEVQEFDFFKYFLWN